MDVVAPERSLGDVWWSETRLKIKKVMDRGNRIYAR